MKQVLRFIATDIASNVKKLLVIFIGIIILAVFVGLFFLTSEGSMDRYIYWFYYGASIVCFIFPIFIELWLFDSNAQVEAGEKGYGKFLLSRWLFAFISGTAGGYVLFAVLTAITAGKYIEGTNTLLWLRPLFISGTSGAGMLVALLFSGIKNSRKTLFYISILGPAWLLFVIEIVLRTRISGSTSLRNIMTLLWFIVAMYSVAWSIVMVKAPLKFSERDKPKN